LPGNLAHGGHAKGDGDQGEKDDIHEGWPVGLSARLMVLAVASMSKAAKK
jgi:hypothetical protein